MRSSTSPVTKNSTPQAEIPSALQTPDEPVEKEKLLGLKPSQIVGGALASCTAAVLGGQLGVAGTVIGAALTSVTIAIGGAIYTRTMDKTTTGLGSVVSKFRRPGEVATPAYVEDPTRALDLTAVAQLPVATKTVPWFRRLPVKIAAAAATFFLIAAVVVSSLESIRGTSVSGGEGTTISQIARGGSSTDGDTRHDRGTATEPTATPTPAAEASTEPTPAAEPTQGSTPAPTTQATTPAPAATAQTTAPTTAPSTRAAEPETTTAPTQAATTAPTGASGS